MELPAQQHEPALTTCPVCDRPAMYLFNPDRYSHLDGTNNRPCWAALSSGRVRTARVETATPLQANRPREPKLRVLTPARG
jgi:hypothetical protein